MATRSLQVQITGDARSLNRVLDTTESRTRRWGGAMAKGFAVAGAAAAGGLAVGLKKSAEAAIEAERSQAKLQTQLRAAGVSWKAHAGDIDRAIQAHSKLSGIDDEELQDAFTNIVRVTGNVNQSLRLTGLAADFARAKHIEVAKAGELVGKVAGGNTGILSRYGIVVGKNATATEALGILQQKFAGQAEAYGKTTAGALSRATVASENLSEIVGAKLTPLLAKAANALVNVVESVQRNWPQMKRTVDSVIGPVRSAINSVVATVRRFRERNRDDIAAVVAALRNLGKAAQYWFEQVVLPTVRVVMRAVGRVLENGLQVFRGFVRIVSGILTGNWRRVWDGAKDIVAGSLKGIVNTIRGAGEIMVNTVKVLGRQIVKGLVAALSGLGNAIKNAVVSQVRKGVGAASGAVSDVIGKLNPFGDGIGRAARNIAGEGLGFMGGSAGKSGAGLMGADFDLGPFARIGANMGLSVSSGLRPGSVTSSGNQSYHSSGDAIDMSGPASGMMRFFRAMKGMFGSRLRELIYTPGGAGIKDGKPYTFGGQVAADHYDHVHVAYTGPFGDGPGRKPGTGDGLGQYASTAYGPPWNAMNGTGVTATGVDLRPAKQAYGIAVDPSRLKLGRNYYVWPNPFGRKGPFKAFDTGGAIKGNRIDFYDWRGRASQLRWGRRSVTLSSDPGLNTSSGENTSPGRRQGGSGSPGPVSFSPGRSGSPNMQQGTGRVGGGEAPARLLGPGQGGYEQKLSDVGVAKAQAENRDNLPGLIKAWQQERAFKRRRLKKINKGLRGRRTAATRKQMTDEKAQLIIDLGEINGLLKEYRADQRGGATTITQAEAMEAGVAADTGSGAAGDADPGPTAMDYLNLDAARATMTPGLEDDLDAAHRIRESYEASYWGAVAQGDPRAQTEWIGLLNQINGTITDLNATITGSNERAEEEKRSRDAHTAALADVAAQTKRQTDLAVQWASTSEFQKTKFIADLISSQFGRGIGGRGLMPGVGVEHAY